MILKRQANEEEKDGLYRNKDYHRALAKETELGNIERVPGGRITQGVYDYVADHFPDKNREAVLSNRKSDLGFLREQAAFESTQHSKNEFFTKEIERDRIEGGRFQREYVEDAVKHQERVHEASTTLNKMASTVNTVSDSLEESSVGKAAVSKARNIVQAYSMEVHFSTPQKNDLSTPPFFRDKTTEKGTHQTIESLFGDKTTEKGTHQTTEESPNSETGEIGAYYGEPTPFKARSRS